MNFFIDAQLPRRLAQEIAALGGECSHPLNLSEKNRTGDAEVTAWALRTGSVIVTKDHDFVAGHLLRGQPEKLVLITTGNITNNELVRLILLNWQMLNQLLDEGNFVELSRTAVTLHG